MGVGVGGGVSPNAHRAKNWATCGLGMPQVLRLPTVTTRTLPREATRSPAQCARRGSVHRYECLNDEERPNDLFQNPTRCAVFAMKRYEAPFTKAN